MHIHLYDYNFATNNEQVYAYTCIFKTRENAIVECPLIKIIFQKIS